MPLKERWAKMVKDARAKLGLSQEGFAAKLGVDQGTVSKWENGRNSRPQFEHRRQVIEILGGGNARVFFSLAEMTQHIERALTPQLLVTGQWVVVTASIGARAMLPSLAENQRLIATFVVPEDLDALQRALISTGFFEGVVLSGTFTLRTADPGGRVLAGEILAFENGREIMPWVNFGLVSPDIAEHIGGLWSPLARDSATPH